MKILAIETSCDDTGISIIKAPQNKSGGFGILSNIVSSQIEIHKKYGGVFPAMAKREHQNNLVPTFKKALKTAELLKNSKKQIINFKVDVLKEILKREGNLYESLKNFLENYKKPDIDLIAVTEGPGLEPCLWAGINFAKAISYFWDIPVVPVNHIEAHILVNLLDLPLQAGNKKIELPAISLVVSGGHTQIILMEKIGKYEIIGETRDDAAGECFDKAAKILGLSYPGGPIISKIASKIKESATKLPRPMINTKDYDFSFSGLKTAVLYKVKDFKVSTIDQSVVLNKKFIQEMCFEVQQSIIDVLLKKTIKAAKDYKAKIIILGGGVSANEELRKQFTIKANRENFKIIFPEKNLSTDNALMIAITGYFHKNKKVNWKKLTAKANLRIE